MKQCNSCQTRVDDSANFCNSCGCSDFTPIPEDPARETVSANPATYYADGGIPAAAPPRKPLSKGLVIGLCGAAAALIAVIVLIVILNNPVRQFMKAVEAADSVQASQIYYESIYGNADRSEEADARLADYADEQLLLYLNGEISYDELSANLWAIDAAGVYNANVLDCLSRAADVYNYRETYAQAEEAFNRGDYADAIVFCSRIIGDDLEFGGNVASMLAEATSRYREEILTAVRQYIENNEFPTAYALLSEAFTVLPNDAALTAAYEECVQAEYDYTIARIIEETRIYCGSNDYIGAIGFLDGQIVLYPDEARLQDARGDCLTQFETYVISESFRLANEGNFTHAASLAASGLEYFTSTTVTELYQIYISHIPVNLGDMEIFKNDTEGGMWVSNTNKTDQYLEDKYGNTYSHSFSVGCGSVTYLLNFKYQTFSGTVAFPKALTADNARESATLTIYGDGKEIAVFRDVTDTTKAEAFSLDISGYEKITLTWEAEGYNIWLDWGDFATIFDGQLIPIPLELPTSVG